LTAGDGIPGINENQFLLTPERQLRLAVLGQAGFGVGVGAVLAIMEGRAVAISWLLGVFVAVVPSAFLAARLLGSRADAKAVLRAAWVGEIGKFALTVLLFGVIFASVRPFSALAVFGGFISAQMVAIGVLAFGGRAGNEHVVTKN